MSAYKLVNNESALRTYVYVADFAEIAANATSANQVTVGVIPAGGAVSLCAVTNTVDIVGSSSLVVDVGTTLADPDEFINALDVDGMTVGLPTFNTGDLFVQSAGTTTIAGGVLPIAAASASTPVYIKVTDTAVASITAGEILIGLEILDLTQYRI